MTRKNRRPLLEPLWYKDAVIYELHVRGFHDSNADGIGDFRGLTQKLDYLQNLGVTAIWLLPFYPSPMRDDGYDIADYYRINPQFGTLAEFRTFLREAHSRGLRVITELVINHTSDQHEWFRKSRRAKPGSAWRDFYVWSDTPEKYRDARIIFKDFESSNWSWDAAARAYYWHRFYSHQPDLNFDNPAVAAAVLKVMDFWFEMGVDGMRLDAVPYLFEREGTNCENLPETFAFLERLRAHVDRKFSDRLLLAEANQWPEDAVAYFGGGNRCHMAFHFPLMPRLFMATWMEDRFPIVDIFDQTPSIPDTCQWALFLRNHDELTLEMVSDEERDYMYQVFARDPSARINLGIRRRLAPLLGNNRRKVELMNILLFSLPGTPVIYYGDEIGMGDNHYLGDRNGVRTPMQWNADRNAGFSRANPQKLHLPVIIDPDYHYESTNVENQERNLSSLYWWTRRIIATRKRFKAFGRGTLEFLDSDNPKVLAFVRRYEDETILVVVNLSRFSQAVTLDLSSFAGHVPEEMVSGNRFPAITNDRYLFTLGFNDYYWFSLEREEADSGTLDPSALPELTLTGRWDAIFQGRSRERLERDILPLYLERCRWFGGKARTLQQLRIVDTIALDPAGERVVLAILDLRYLEGSNESYLLPLAFSPAAQGDGLAEFPQARIAALKTPQGSGLLFDAAYHDPFRRYLITLIARRQGIKGGQGELVAYPGAGLKRHNHREIAQHPAQILRAEQSNTSILYGSALLLKLFRRLEEGTNPDLEVNRFLTEEARYPNVPAFAGGIEYRRRGMEPVVLGVLQDFVKNEGDAWSFTVGSAGRYFDRVLALGPGFHKPPLPPPSLFDAGTNPPLDVLELVGGLYFELAALLGKRTAELHLALANHPEDVHFSPEPFSLLYQRSLYHSFRTLTKRVTDLLRKNLPKLDETTRADARSVLTREKEMLERFARLLRKKLPAMKLRIHGDYHLGQVLFTGNDFVIIDFEGEPARSLSERRLKRSPLRDVAGMIRSFHYPTHSILHTQKSLPNDLVGALKPWAEIWHRYVAGTFLSSYLRAAGDAPFLPPDREDREVMLNAYLLAKALYEVAYELNNRPAWASIPLAGIINLLDERHGAH